VGLVDRTPGLLKRREADVVRKRADLHVIAEPEIQREAIVGLPVVLHPARDLFRIEMDVEIADADAVAPRDRGDRRQVPGVRVERIGKERLEIGGWGSAPRVKAAHAPPATALNLA